MTEKIRESDDPYYDLIEDFDLIVSSFQTQYGIRLSKELSGMKWDEFSDLLSGLGPDTPLGHVVAIRAEDDDEVLRKFTNDQRRIRSRWRAKRAKNIPQAEVDDVLENLKTMFVQMAGGGKN